MRSGLTNRVFVAVLIASFVLGACESVIPPEALQLSKESLERRQVQTRRFDTADEAKLLSASVAVMQDLGFTLDESETKLGLIVASKDRDAVEAGQVAAAIFIALFAGVAIPIDRKQKIRISLVTRPIDEQGKTISVRATFHRIVWNDHNKARTEHLDDPKMYQEFFSKLSKAVFLEAHKI